MTELYRAICVLLGRAFEFFGRLIYRHPWHVMVLLASLALSGMVWYGYRESAVQPITLYVGMPGTSSYRLKDKLSSAIENASPAPGYGYTVNIVTTQGYLDIKERIEHDPSGQAIGMLVDGMESPQLRTLLPMDWDYLQILARVDFLEDCRRQLSDRSAAKNEAPFERKHPRRFSEVVEFLKYGKVYAGPDASGTRKFAELLFNKHQTGPGRKKIEDVVAVGMSNWEQAIAALKEGEIDLAFYCGPLGATTVEEVCSDQSAVLLGIEDLQASMIKADSFAVIEGTIPQHYYSAAPFSHVKPGSAYERVAYEPPLYFNDQSVSTIAARRLIVTSASMSDANAYTISRALAKTLLETRNIPKDTWRRRSPDETVARENSDFGIVPHAGAALARDNVPLVQWWNPGTWNRSLLVFLGGLLTVAATSLLQWLISSSRAETGTTDESSNARAGNELRGDAAQDAAPSAMAEVQPAAAQPSATVAPAEERAPGAANPEPSRPSPFFTLLEKYFVIKRQVDATQHQPGAESEKFVADLLSLGKEIDTADAAGMIDKQQSDELMFDWRELKRDIQLLSTRHRRRKKTQS